MNWSDECFLISKNRYNENSIIAEVYTKKRGKISGMIFGGTSKKIKNYLQIGNKLHLNYNSKMVKYPAPLQTPGNTRRYCSKRSLHWSGIIKSKRLRPKLF